MKKLSSEITDKVLEFNKLLITPSIISNQLKISRKSVYNILERNDIRINGVERFNHHRKYDVNLSYFEKIDCPEKAYFLGWIYSDGCMIKKSYSFKIGIQKRDKEILEKLIKLISKNTPIKTIKRKSGHDKYHRQDLVVLRINRKKIYNDLLKLGLYPNKSETLSFPTFSQVPEEFIFHFIRGYFDGDGCIFVKCRNKLVPKFSSGMVCSKSFANTLMKILKKYKIKSRLQKKSNTDKVIDLSIPNSIDCIKFLEKIYEDKRDLFLKRKYEKYLKILQGYVASESKINFKTINLFKKNNIFKNHTNIDIDFNDHWVIDHRHY